MEDKELMTASFEFLLTPAMKAQIVKAGVRTNQSAASFTRWAVEKALSYLDSIAVVEEESASD